MKRFTSFILSLLLCCLLVVPVFASSNNESALIIQALRDVEYDKNEFGLGDVNFSSLQIGNEAIHFYNYTENGFEDTRIAYPLFNDDTLVALALRSAAGTYQISTSLVSSLSAGNFTELALIYDRHSCFAFDGDTIQLLHSYPEEILTRGVITDSVLIPGDIKLGNLSLRKTLGYTATMERSVSPNYSCSVTYVPQGSYNICWAASTACIVNSVKGTNYTALEVAKAKYGETNFNQGLHIADVAAFMDSEYGLWYSCLNIAPSSSIIVSNISGGFPVYARFVSSDGSSAHGVTIYGINTRNQYIRIMDPAGGIGTGYYSSGEFTYDSDYHNISFELDKMACRYWS